MADQVASEPQGETELLPLTRSTVAGLGSTIKFMMSQIELLAERSFSEGHQEWLERCDAYNAGRRAIALIDKINNTRAARPDDGELPLCAVHKRLERSGKLKMAIGGFNCVACSLNEREELLKLLAPFTMGRDEAEDSLTVLRRLADFYNTHSGDGRVVVSYPAHERI